PFSRYHTLFTYGENVHRAGCSMPTGGFHWLPTRQPVVLDLWENKAVPHEAPITSIMNWSAYGDHKHNDRVYGQKDRQFTPFFSLPKHVNRKMELAVNAPKDIISRLHRGGWSIATPSVVSKTPWTYQEYISNSAAEFCVAKHAYVTTGSGWFSDRSAAFLASGRPVVIEDTGFSNFLSCGEGLLPYKSQAQAIKAINNMLQNYSEHAKAAREIAVEFFDADKVLSDLLMQSI
ncbi:MAG: glycosyltransferase, partial [Gammaproteobacteria bacterium]|nr:glycosyltransferase [Gammaproteobacteria bacterium]